MPQVHTIASRARRVSWVFSKSVDRLEFLDRLSNRPVARADSRFLTLLRMQLTFRIVVDFVHFASEFYSVCMSSRSFLSVSPRSNAYFRPISSDSTIGATVCVEAHAYRRRSSSTSDDIAVLTPRPLLSPTASNSTVSLPEFEISELESQSFTSIPSDPTNYALQTQPLRQVPTTCQSVRFNLGDKDGDEGGKDSPCMVVSDDELSTCCGSTSTPSPVASPKKPKLDIFVPEDLESFSCPYFYATADNGIEQATPAIAAAMKISNAQLAAIAPTDEARRRGGDNAAMRVSQTTVLGLVPLSVSRDGSGGSTNLALHLPSLSLMTVKIVPITDARIKGEFDCILSWAETGVPKRRTTTMADAKAASCSSQFYGAFPSYKHNALVFAYAYDHHESTPERVAAQLKVLALARKTLMTIGCFTDIETIAVNVSRQMETPLNLVRACLLDG